jgi:hypothetical protein
MSIDAEFALHFVQTCENADAPQRLGLLRAGNDMPNNRAAKKCNELAPSHCRP